MSLHRSSAAYLVLLPVCQFSEKKTQYFLMNLFSACLHLRSSCFLPCDNTYFTNLDMTFKFALRSYFERNVCQKFTRHNQKLLLAKHIHIPSTRLYNAKLFGGGGLKENTCINCNKKYEIAGFFLNGSNSCPSWPCSVKLVAH